MAINAGQTAAGARQDVLTCFGDPVVDIVIRCSHAFMRSIGAEEGGSQLVSPTEMAQLRDAALNHPDTEGPQVRCVSCPLYPRTFAWYMPHMLQGRHGTVVRIQSAHPCVRSK